MRYRLPIGSEIIPFATKSGQQGGVVQTTVVVDFEEKDILQRLHQQIQGVEIEFMCLSLGENPSPFDSYLFKATDCILVEG